MKCFAFTLWSLLLLLMIDVDNSLALRSPVASGNIIVDGTGSLSMYGGEAYESEIQDQVSLVKFAVSANVLLRPGIAVGGRLGMFRIAQGWQLFTVRAIGPQVTYYLRSRPRSEKASGEAYPFVMLAYTYGKSDGGFGEEFPFGVFSYPDFDVHSLHLSLGLTYMLGEHVGLTTVLTRRHDFIDLHRDDYAEGNGFEISLGLSFVVW